MKKGENIINILMRRDGLSRKEAENTLKEAKEELMDAILGVSCMDPEEVIMEVLGLEPDYIFDLI